MRVNPYQAVRFLSTSQVALSRVFNRKLVIVLFTTERTKYIFPRSVFSFTQEVIGKVHFIYFEIKLNISILKLKHMLVGF